MVEPLAQAGGQHVVQLHYNNAPLTSKVKPRTNEVLTRLGSDVRRERLEALGLGDPALQLGVAEPVVGASGDGGAHYAPAFSPDGRWIAYTHSARGRTTYAAPDARLRLVRADQSGAVDDLAAANLPLGVAGSSSYPAWSPSGRTLAFTRRIVTGRHDAYNRRPADAYIARFDPVTGTVGPGVPVPGQNTYFVERTPVFIP